MDISKETATDIALAYREVETAEKMLQELTEQRQRWQQPDIRDAFGRLQGGLQLGVPSGKDSHRLFNVEWQIAIPIIETHIAAGKAKIRILTEKARVEIQRDPSAPCPSTLPWKAHNPGDLAPNRVNIICEGADVIICANIEIDHAVQVISAHNAEPVNWITGNGDQSK
jgi:hypothetical protein